MKKTVQLLAFLVTAGIVFSSANYKGFHSYYVNSSPYFPVPPFNIEECLMEINYVIESPIGIAYWALYDLRWGRFVTSFDVFPHMTIHQYIDYEGYYYFSCRQIYLILE